jgi:tRNA(Ile)-lysidine synthase
MNQSFINFMDKYKKRRIAVAVSGGADSMALLHKLGVRSEELGVNRACGNTRASKQEQSTPHSSLLTPNLTALTVDHGLRKESELEAQMVAKACTKLGIEHHILKWVGEKPSTGIEARAREARYELMLKFCRENGVDVLMTAHQADDQIETFLLNLGRGSGVYGLAGMRAEQVRDGITIARPLLQVSRAELRKYCEDNNIKFIDDPMNHDPKFLRVKIRQNRRLLREKLDISDARILAAVNALGRVREALEDDVEALAESVYINARAVFQEDFLFDLDTEIQLKLLSYLIQKIGGEKYPIRMAQIKSAIQQLRGDCKFTLGHCVLRRLGKKILIAREGESASFKKCQ